MFRLRLFLAACAVLCIAYITHASPVFAQAACFPEESLNDNFVVGPHSGTLKCLGSTINYTPPNNVVSDLADRTTFDTFNYTISDGSAQATATGAAESHWYWPPAWI